jgi:hypothetical protein
MRLDWRDDGMCRRMTLASAAQTSDDAGHCNENGQFIRPENCLQSLLCEYLHDALSMV